MAFSPQRPGDDEPLATINVTPFVDVVLVLLIIFMITAGIADFGLEIDVPKTREIASSPEDHPFVNVTANGEIYYNTDPVTPADVPLRVFEDSGIEPGSQERPALYLRADEATPWEVIAPVLEACQGKIDVNMVTKPLEQQ